MGSLGAGADERARAARSGGRILVDQLRIQGTSIVYCVPGESYLPVLDALGDHEDDIRTITCRHEANAANMAEATGKLLGTPGICFVTRGPGATHAAIAVHTAMQDSTPMILFIGQIPTSERDREAFQEIAYEQLFGPVTKWSATISHVERVPEYVARAFQVATSGRPGPVVLALPEEVLFADAEVPDAPKVVPVEAAPPAVAVAEAAALIEGAARPVVVVGGSGWTQSAVDRVTEVAESARLPVATMFRRQDLIASTSPSYVGSLGAGGRPALRDEVAAADVVLLVGARADALSTAHYRLLGDPTQQLVHVHPSPDEVGRNVAAVMRIASPVGPFLDLLAEQLRTDGAAWGARTTELRSLQERYACSSTPADDGPLSMTATMAVLQEELPPGTAYTNGAGNFTLWCHRFLRFTRYPSQLAPTSGAMGYGLPAAIAAGLLEPDRPVVTVAGDGDFLMSSADMITAARYGARVIAVVANNGAYGTIRMHQGSHYPGRLFATDLTNPDFAALAVANGWSGTRATTVPELRAALQQAVRAVGPSLIEVPVDAAWTTPDHDPEATAR